MRTKSLSLATGAGMLTMAVCASSLAGPRGPMSPNFQVEGASKSAYAQGCQEPTTDNRHRCMAFFAQEFLEPSTGTPYHYFSITEWIGDFYAAETRTLQCVMPQGSLNIRKDTATFQRIVDVAADCSFNSGLIYDASSGEYVEWSYSGLVRISAVWNQPSYNASGQQNSIFVDNSLGMATRSHCTFDNASQTSGRLDIESTVFLLNRQDPMSSGSFGANACVDNHK